MGARRLAPAAAALLVLAFAGGLLSCAGPSATPAAEAASGDSAGSEAALPAAAQPVPAPFRAGTGPDALWGYRAADGAVVIPPRYVAAADFSGGEALVLDRGEYVFIDPTGEVRQRLGSEAGAQRLPLPSDSCASLRQYAEELGALSPVHTLSANPAQGESALTLEVRRLRFGAIEVRELGWEGMSRVLVLPRATRADADAIVERLLRHHQHREITAQRVFDDLATYELVAPELAAEFLGVRARPGGGFEIHHTQWAS